jgi:hypothetical protein
MLGALLALAQHVQVTKDALLAFRLQWNMLCCRCT